jgi:hypothetical protein
VRYGKFYPIQIICTSKIQKAHRNLRAFLQTSAKPRLEYVLKGHGFSRDKKTT